MTYQIHEKELQNVFNLDAKERYEHFIGKTCDWEEVWLLSDSKQCVLKVAFEGVEYIPVWPHPDYAVAFAKNSYSEYRPAHFDIYSFVDSFLKEFVGLNIKIGVLPNLETTVWLMTPEDLQEDISDELGQYE